MRTYEEIVAFAKDYQSRAPIFGGFSIEVVFGFLPFAMAKAFMNAEALAKPDAEVEWEKERTPLTREEVLKELREYMAFAWEKVQDQRGLSACRSVIKIETLIYMLGDEEPIKAFRDADGDNYGADKLLVACLHYDLPFPEEFRK